jgi:peptide/nickel transport system permease protein
MSKLAMTLKILRHPASLYLLCLVAASIIVPIVLHQTYSEPNILNRNSPPFWDSKTGKGLFGTDEFGNDVLLQIIKGARFSIGISVSVTLVASLFGTAVGVGAAMLNRMAGSVVMRIVDGFMSFPGLLIAVVILYLFGPGFWKIIGTLAFLVWPAYARVAFSDGLRIRESPYVTAARVSGIPGRRIASHYVFPGVVKPVAALAAVSIGGVMLAESSLSFLGLGIQPPGVSWGLMIAEGRSYFPGAWWSTLFPGLAIAFTAVALNSWAAWTGRIVDPLARAASRGAMLRPLFSVDRELEIATSLPSEPR